MELQGPVSSSGHGAHVRVRPRGGLRLVPTDSPGESVTAVEVNRLFDLGGRSARGRHGVRGDMGASEGRQGRHRSVSQAVAPASLAAAPVHVRRR